MKPRLLAPVFLLLAACAEAPDTVHETFFALGTVVDVSIVDPPPRHIELLHELEELLLEDEHRWRAFREGELAGLNLQLARGETVTVSGEMRAGIVEAKRLSERSRGLFNPAIGRLVMLWGFHDVEAIPARPPEDMQIEALLPSPAMNALTIAGNEISSRDPALWLDMGAFAKGLALEKAASRLRAADVSGAIINAGGDMKVLGHAGGRDWRIGIRHPRDNHVFAAVTVGGNESVFTSGDYERFFEHGGARFHHLLDPRSGRPARGLASVTVVVDDAALADAASTALFIAGPVEWPRAASDLGISAAMVVLDNGDIQLTPAMNERVSFTNKDQASTVVTP